MKILIDFSGWIEADPQNINFQYFGNDTHMPQYINGVDYIKLSEEERKLYVIESLGKAIVDSFDGEYDSVNIYLEKE